MRTAASPATWLPASLAAALDRGVVAVTPNERLARLVRDEVERAHLERGDRVWETAQVLSWGAWLRVLRETAVLGGGGALPRLLLTPWQAAQVWHDIVASSKAMPALLHPRYAAGLAGEAWALFHDWRERDDDEVWNLPAAMLADDPSAFAGWARRFALRCRDEGWLDQAGLATEISRAVAVQPWIAPAAVRFVGFLEWSPARRRLASALRGAGTDLDEVALVTPAPVRPVPVQAARDATEELFAAAAWARELLARDPVARIAVVVPALESVRIEAARAFEQVLCPNRAIEVGNAQARPFNVSLGAPLASIPLVAAALTLLRLAVEPVAASELGRLLVSPHLGGGEDAGAVGVEPARRAAAERLLAESGRDTVELSEVIRLLGKVGSALVGRWSRWRQGLAGLPRRLAPVQWRTRFAAWLESAGWLQHDDPAGGLSSAEHQARQAFTELLDRWATLGVVHPRISASDALRGVREFAAEQPFQPESAEAPVQVLGELEAAGLPFDAIRVCGLTADAWPKAPQPNPLLPIAWQRRQGLPRAGAQREREYAQALLALFAGAAPNVVFSWPMRRGDEDLARSPLIGAAAGGADVEPALAAAVDTAPIASARRAPAPMLEPYADVPLPALVEGSVVRGGAGLLSQQSECPFQAAADGRLRASAWQQAGPGLDAAERGQVVHAALHALWDGVESQARMRALEPAALASRVAAASAAGVSALRAERWAPLPSLVIEVERRRLARLISEWLAVEFRRPPFEVAAVERKESVAVGGLQLEVRIDRVDRLADGRLVVIDYKTGKRLATSRFAEPADDGRLGLPQLPVYRRAIEQAGYGGPVCAVVYASVRIDDAGVAGVASDDGVWPGIPVAEVASKGAFADWAALTAHWDQGAEALAQAFRAGDARVAPRKFPQTCQICAHQPLCRIGELRARSGLATIAATDEIADDGGDR